MDGGSCARRLQALTAAPSPGGGRDEIDDRDQEGWGEGSSSQSSSSSVPAKKRQRFGESPMLGNEFDFIPDLDGEVDDTDGPPQGNNFDTIPSPKRDVVKGDEFDEIPECQLRNVLRQYFDGLSTKLWGRQEGSDGMAAHFISILDRLKPVLKRHRCDPLSFEIENDPFFFDESLMWLRPHHEQTHGAQTKQVWDVECAWAVLDLTNVSSAWVKKASYDKARKHMRQPSLHCNGESESLLYWMSFWGLLGALRWLECDMKTGGVPTLDALAAQSLAQQLYPSFIALELNLPCLTRRFNFKCRFPCDSQLFVPKRFVQVCILPFFVRSQLGNVHLSIPVDSICSELLRLLVVEDIVGFLFIPERVGQNFDTLQLHRLKPETRNQMECPKPLWHWHWQLDGSRRDAGELFWRLVEMGGGTQAGRLMLASLARIADKIPLEQRGAVVGGGVKLVTRTLPSAAVAARHPPRARVREAVAKLTLRVLAHISSKRESLEGLKRLLPLHVKWRELARVCDADIFDSLMHLFSSERRALRLQAHPLWPPEDSRTWPDVVCNLLEHLVLPPHRVLEDSDDELVVLEMPRSDFDEMEWGRRPSVEPMEERWSNESDSSSSGSVRELHAGSADGQEEGAGAGGGRAHAGSEPAVGEVDDGGGVDGLDACWAEARAAGLAFNVSVSPVAEALSSRATVAARIHATWHQLKRLPGPGARRVEHDGRPALVWRPWQPSVVASLRVLRQMLAEQHEEEGGGTWRQLGRERRFSSRLAPHATEDVRGWIGAEPVSLVASSRVVLFQEQRGQQRTATEEVVHFEASDVSMVAAGVSQGQHGPGSADGDGEARRLFLSMVGDWQELCRHDRSLSLSWAACGLRASELLAGISAFEFPGDLQKGWDPWPANVSMTMIEERILVSRRLSDTLDSRFNSLMRALRARLRLQQRQEEAKKHLKPLLELHRHAPPPVADCKGDDQAAEELLLHPWSSADGAEEVGRTGWKAAALLAWWGDLEGLESEQLFAVQRLARIPAATLDGILTLRRRVKAGSLDADQLLCMNLMLDLSHVSCGPTITEQNYTQFVQQGARTAVEEGDPDTSTVELRDDVFPPQPALKQTDIRSFFPMLAKVSAASRKRARACQGSMSDDDVVEVLDEGSDEQGRESLRKRLRGA